MLRSWYLIFNTRQTSRYVYFFLYYLVSMVTLNLHAKKCSETFISTFAQLWLSRLKIILVKVLMNWPQQNISCLYHKKRLPVFLPIEIYVAGTIELFRKPLAACVCKWIDLAVGEIVTNKNENTPNMSH